MKTTAQGKKALAKIDTIRMFSDAGWKRVHEKCGHITTDADEETLADGNTDFLIIWLEDNDVEEWDFANVEDVYEQLMGRFVDYLIGDYPLNAR